MTIEYVDERKVVRIFWDDLSASAQKELFTLLGGENGNCDVFPLAEIELLNDTERKAGSGYLICKNCGYKQSDYVTCLSYAEKHPGKELHDIDYLCDACRDTKIKKEMIKCLFQHR